jgi:hypothetical protein
MPTKKLTSPKLETRRCRNPQCDRTFKCLETSKNFYHSDFCERRHSEGWGWKSGRDERDSTETVQKKNRLEAMSLVRKLRNDGKSFADCAQELNRLGIPDPQGKQWKYQTIYNVSHYEGIL